MNSVYISPFYGHTPPPRRIQESSIGTRPKRKYKLPQTLWPSQRSFLHLDTPYAGFSGPVGSGKSMALAVRVIRMALANPGLPGLVAAPTYRLLEDVTEPAVLEALAAARIPHVAKMSKHMITLTDTASVIRFRSMENPHRLVGSNLAWFAVDELTYCKQAAFEKLEARLRHPQAVWRAACAVWTPKGFDWVWKRFISAKDRLEGHTAVMAAPAENRAVLDKDPEYYKRLQRSYDERLYKQEALGEYLNVHSGTVYHAFDRFQNHQPYRFDKNLPLIWTMDFNIDPMCSVLAQEIPYAYGGVGYREHATVNVFEEIHLRGADTMIACQEFINRTKGWLDRTRKLKVLVYGDAAGYQGRTSGASDWTIISKFFKEHELAQHYDVKIMVAPGSANPKVRDRVNAMNGMLRNAHDVRRLMVDIDRCPKLLDDLERVSWGITRAGAPTGEMDKNSDPQLTHLSDALGYYILQEFGIRPEFGYR